MGLGPAPAETRSSPSPRPDRGQSLGHTRLGETGGFSGSQPARVSLIAPSNTVVDGINSNGAQTYTLAESGTHVLRVNATS
jgi:hypothetical protein